MVVTTAAELAFFLTVIQCQLLYVANLYRHGARYPVSKSSFYDANESAPNAGEMSPAGMRQQYNLGRYLRRDYIENQKFLSQSFNHSELQAFSTASLRTVVSAYCQLYGLYPDNTGPRLPEGLDPSYLMPPFNASASGAKSHIAEAEFGLPNGFQPIPVHDASPYLQNCAGIDVLIAQEVLKHIEEFALVDVYYMSFYSRMKQIFKFKSEIDLSLPAMAELYDVLAADKYLGRPFPADFTNADFLNLRHLTHYLALTAYQETASQAVSTPLLQKLIKEFDAKILSPTSIKKWTMLSGHDTNVAPTLWFLNLTTAQCIEDKFRNSTKKYLNCEDGPDFASSLTFQLWNNTKPVVKIQYNGKYMKLCERESTECEYTEWKARIQRQYVDYAKICGNKNMTKKQSVGDGQTTTLMQKAYQYAAVMHKSQNANLRIYTED